MSYNRQSPMGGTAFALIVVGYLGTAGSAAAQEQTKSETPAAAAESAGVANASAAEEVVVTARKHKELLQEVPLSIVAMSGEQLQDRSIEDLADLSRSTPNFTFGEQPQAGRVGGLVFIRGVGQRDPIPAYDPAIGIYLDGIYLGRMWANNLDMMDIERVEVLRGPQGTLFGKNTSGGAVSVVSQKPDVSADTPSGRAQITSGSRSRFDFTGAVNIPLVADKLAVRLSGAHNTQDGFSHRSDGQDQGDINRDAVRAQLLFQPAAQFSALLAGDYLEFDEHNAAFRLVEVNTAAGPVAAYNSRLDPDYDSRWLTSSPYYYQGTGPNVSRGHVGGGSLTLTYEFPRATLTALSAYRELSTINNLDPDGSSIVILNQFQQTRQDQLSQELQLSGTAWDGTLDWVFGAFYFEEDAEDEPSYNLLPALFGTSRDFARYALTESKSIAAFGQGVYSLTDNLRLTAGLRYTQDDKRVTVARLGYGAFAPPPGEHDSDAVSPRLGLDYQWRPGLMTYASVAHGARNGGYTGRPGVITDFIEFDDEEVWTYELGLRSEFFDDRLQFNATAFYSVFKDMQLQINGSTQVGDPPSAQSFTLVTNVPKSSIRGGEIEVLFRPAEHWTLSAAYGYTDARYDELPTDARFTAYVESGLFDLNKEFPNTPEHSFTLASEYTRSIASELNMTVRLDYTYQSDIWYSTENLRNSLQPGFGLLNARLTLDMANAFSMSVFGSNLTNEDYILGVSDDAPKPDPGLGFSVVNQGKPREWGVSLQKRF